MKLHVVLGLARDVEVWRREHGLPPRAVIAVTPSRYTGALRGLSLDDFEVITLKSWGRAPARVIELVEQDLALIRACSPLRTA